MAGRGTRKEAIEHRREDFLQAGYALFSERGIDSVSMRDVASASGHGVATLFRYFETKSGLLVEIADWKWREFFERNGRRRPDIQGTATAAELEMLKDMLLDRYRA